MGKKRIAKKSGAGFDAGLKSRVLSKTPRKKLPEGILTIRATYNNTTATLADTDGNVVAQSSAGALGFSGARKGTPYAAAKVGEVLGEKASMMNMQEATVHIKGVGAGRESLLRSFAGKGVGIATIRDITPIPHNGPRPPKPPRN